MEKIRFGVLGCANVAERLILPSLSTMEEFELVAVSSRTLTKAQYFANKFQCKAIEGYQNLLDCKEIDAVYVPLPTGLHYKWVMNALKSKKHVLVEKSLANSFDCAKEMIDTAGAEGLGLMENFMFVYHSQHQFVKDVINRGEIGEIRAFRSSFGFPPLGDNNIRYQKELGGGSLLDAGAYTLKAQQLFLGDKLEVKAASLKVDKKYGVDIYGGAFSKSKDGLFAEIAFGFDNYYQCSYEIWCSQGKITSERAFTAGPGFNPKIIIEKQNERHEHILPADNQIVNILREFYLCIINKTFEHHYNAMYTQAKLIHQVFNHAEKR